jgi:predicted naringenin-chalcone synthase
VDRRGSILGDGVAAEGGGGAAGFFFLPRDESDRGPGMAARMEKYAALAPPLALSAATKALAHAGVSPGAITHLVSASCTGFAAPGWDIQLIKNLGLAPGVRRLHVGFMGCHAAFNALDAAGTIVAADVQARVLVCCVELCSLHFAYGFDPQRIVANALFADGAAAAVVTGAADPVRPRAGENGSALTSCDREGAVFEPSQAPLPHGRGSSEGAPCLWALCDSASLLLEGSEDAMTWRIGDHGFEMTLAPGVPQLIRAHLPGFIGPWLGRYGLAPADVSNWAVHPGGPKVLSAAAAALGLDDSALAVSRRVLAEHGNMSSATILFILEALAANRAPGPTVALGFGPGLVLEAMLLV